MKKQDIQRLTDLKDKVEIAKAEMDRLSNELSILKGACDHLNPNGLSAVFPVLERTVECRICNQRWSM